jgi:hypothetical protein
MAAGMGRPGKILPMREIPEKRGRLELCAPSDGVPNLSLPTTSDRGSAPAAFLTWGDVSQLTSPGFPWCLDNRRIEQQRLGCDKTDATCLANFGQKMFSTSVYIEMDFSYGLSVSVRSSFPHLLRKGLHRTYCRLQMLNTLPQVFEFRIHFRMYLMLFLLGRIVALAVWHSRSQRSSRDGISRQCFGRW